MQWCKEGEYLLVPGGGRGLMWQKENLAFDLLTCTITHIYWIFIHIKEGLWIPPGVFQGSLVWASLPLSNTHWSDWSKKAACRTSPALFLETSLTSPTRMQPSSTTSVHWREAMRMMVSWNIYHDHGPISPRVYEIINEILWKFFCYNFYTNDQIWSQFHSSVVMAWGKLRPDWFTFTTSFHSTIKMVQLIMA